MQNQPYPVEVQLTGEDGNAFGILGKVSDAIAQYLREETDSSARDIQEVKDRFLREATSGDYDHLLKTCAEWTEVR